MKRSKWIVGFQFLPHFSIKVLSELRWRRICSQFKIIAQSVSGGEVIGNCKNNSSQSSTFIQQAGFPQATVPTLPLIPNFSCLRSRHEWKATFVRMKIEEKAGHPLQLLWDGTFLASKWLRGKVSFPLVFSVSQVIFLQLLVFLVYPIHISARQVAWKFHRHSSYHSLLRWSWPRRKVEWKWVILVTRRHQLGHFKSPSSPSPSSYSSS